MRPSKRKLCIGLLMDSYAIPAWAFTMLERINESDYGEFGLVVLNQAAKKELSILSEFGNNWKKFVYRSFRRLEDQKYKLRNNAYEIKDATALLANVPTLKVRPKQKKHSDYFEDKDIIKIQRYGVHVFIRFGFRILKGKILTTAEFGIWSFYHGYYDKYKDAPAGLWEVLQKQPTICCILQILSEHLGEGLTLCKSFSSTDVFSLNKTCNRHYWKISAFIPRKLEELNNLGKEAFFENVSQRTQIECCSSIEPFRPLHHQKLPKLLIRHILRNIRFFLYKNFFQEQWILLFDLNNDSNYSFSEYKKIIPPKDRLWADPHIIYKDKKYFIFLEEKSLKTGKGHIAFMVMDEQGNYSKPIKIIEKPYHLSYPFVFEWKGHYYMIPESSASKTIQLYKAVKFPEQWELEKNLMENIDAADTTLFFFRQKWWLFTNIKESDGCTNWDELFLFYTDDLLNDKWQLHPQNPIVSDVRKARPAGKIFQNDGVIYRPSQNSAGRYGYGLKMNQIMKLSETVYEEIEVKSLIPGWDKNILGIHSFNKEKNLTVIDGKYRRPKYF